MDKTDIFLCMTLRHLLNSLIISKKSKRECIIFFCYDHQNIGTLNINFNFFSNCKVFYLNESNIIEDFKKNNWLNFSNIISKNYRVNFNGLFSAASFIEAYLNIYLTNIVINEIYIYHDRTFLSKFFLKKKNINMIEDGLANYYEHPVENIYKKVSRFIQGLKVNKYVMGESKNINKIYLSEPDMANEIIRIKVHDLKKLFINIDEETKDNLCNMFGINENYNNSIIFLTQGLDVANLCTFDEKMKIYKDIFKCFSLGNKNIYVKPHPSESLDDYRHYFNDCSNIKIINNKTPFEVISLVNENIEVISLFSSSKIFTGNGMNNVFNLIDSQEDWKEFDINNIVCIANKNLTNHLKNK